MLDTLKSHLFQKDTAAVISLIESHPAVLEEMDENKSSGFMLIAYSGINPAFKRAITLRQTFTFHEAIVAGKRSILKKFISSGPDSAVNSYSGDGFTPLSLAAFFNRTAIAKLLLENGADPNLQATNPTKVNALHSAVAKENYELCKLLIENGADVNAPQVQNVTALHSAAHRGNLELVQLLVDHGAQTDRKMHNGDTALAIAKRDGHQRVAGYLAGKNQGN